MGNANIAYIDYIESYLDILNSNFPKWFRKIVYKYFKLLLCHIHVFYQNFKTYEYILSYEQNFCRNL